MSKESHSNLVRHAEREFKVLGWPGEDDMQKLICQNIVELLYIFGGQGHSGTTAPYVLNLFEKLAAFKPISPLTGADGEWNDVGDGHFQNNRDSEVFKDKDGHAYWIAGRIFRDLKGHTWNRGAESRVHVTFPWTRPEPEVIDCD